MRIPCIVSFKRAALTIAVIGAASLAKAQAPMTLDELKSILSDAAATSQQMETLNSNIQDVNRRGSALARKLADHNAHPCTYPEGHPEVCAAYDQEARDIDAEGHDLLAKATEYADRKESYKHHIMMLMLRLRVAPFLGALEEWKNQVVACSQMRDEEGMAGCLKELWERFP